ncbi:MAG: dipeptidyl-peptidase 3 family protein, partial [Cyclobacteriaceae bacterium]
MKAYVFLLIVALCSFSCDRSKENGNNTEVSSDPDSSKINNENLDVTLEKYKTIRLTADLSSLTEGEKQMIPLLIEAAKIMDSLFWYEAYGDQESLLKTESEVDIQRFIEINYGPWDRLDDDKPFISGAGPKPKGANFYPADMTVEEFEQSDLADKNSLYTFLRRDAAGQLETIPFHQYFAEQVSRAAELLEDAAGLAEAPGLKKYLILRAEALRTDEYKESDLAWMDMKDNT